MKTLIQAALMITLITIAANTNAQNNKEQKEQQSKKVSITIITEENGKQTVLDTTFEANDEAAIEYFMKSNKIKKPLPPLPPLPPVHPAPAPSPNQTEPPKPPSKPDLDDEHFSFEFNFDDEDIDGLSHELDDQMMEIKEQLEQAKKEIKMALEKSKISKKEMENLRDQIIKELDEIDIDVSRDKKNKQIIIHKKTGDIGNEKDIKWNTAEIAISN